jgi:hypothetical protein
MDDSPLGATETQHPFPTQQPPHSQQPAPGFSGAAPMVRSVRPTPSATKFAWMVAAVASAGFIVCGRILFAGLAGSLYIIVLVCALIGTRTVKRRAEPVAWLCASAIVGLGLTLRASPWLITLNIVAVIALLGVGALTGQGGSLFRASKPTVVEGVLRTCGAWLTGFALIRTAWRWLSSTDRKWHRSKRVDPASSHRGIARSILFAAPVLLLVVPLLRAGDAVFYSIIGKVIRFPISVVTQINVDGWSIIDGSVGLWGGLILLAIAGAQPRLMKPVKHNPTYPQTPRPGSVVHFESQIFPVGTKPVLDPVVKKDRLVRDVVGAAWILNAVLLIFAGGQVANAFGLAERAKAEVVSYQQIAKEGFFPLLVACAIVLASLATAHFILGESRWQRSSIRALQSTILLTLMVIVVASRRLWIGADIWGLTMLRVLSQSAAVLLGVIFGYLGFWQRKRTDRLAILGVALAAAVSILVGLNMLPIEAIIVRWNTSRPSPSNAQNFDRDSMDPLDPKIGRAFGVSSCEDYFNKWHGKNADATLALGPISRDQIQRDRIDTDCVRDLLHCDEQFDTGGLRYNWARSQANDRKSRWCPA